MDNGSRFGVFLPTYIWPDDGPERARNIKTFARRVEELGFDSLFVTDHLLTARRFYSASFLDSLTTLALAAGVTERVRLGTSVLVLPVRHPVILAKELSTLQYLSGNRVILGAGLGWYPPEFRAAGTRKSHRGARADELLDIAIPLMEGETVTYEGVHFSVEEVAVEPRAERRPTLWIGGGSQLADDASPEQPRFAEAVKRRCLRAEGWIARPTCPPDDIARDWGELSRALDDQGRDRSAYTVAHENFMHYVPTRDAAEARERQHEAFLRVMSDVRGREYLESVYLLGTPDEIVASLQARIDAGVEYFLLHTLTPDAEQLTHWLTDILPNLTFPAPGAGRGRAELVGSDIHRDR
jgi:probable F420-dependent oxidoreductase